MGLHDIREAVEGRVVLVDRSLAHATTTPPEQREKRGPPLVAVQRTMHVGPGDPSVR